MPSALAVDGRPVVDRSGFDAPPSSLKGRTCAMVLSNAVGDGVLMMALAHNLVRHGAALQVHGQVAEQLAAWYPWCDIVRAAAPVPSVPSVPLVPLVPPRPPRPPELTPVADGQDLVVELYDTARGRSLTGRGSSVAVAALPGFGAGGGPMLDRIIDSGARHLGLTDPVRASGIVVPEAVARRRDARRVVIHPTASHPEKTWQPAKFLALASALKARGFEPSFIVMPGELAAWQATASACQVPVFAFASLDGVAAWIAQAGWFIGNDSGPGHLASAIGVPTVSLFMRRGLARTWRPSWAPGRVVLPIGLLPGATLRERHWQRLLSVRRVLRAFDDLRHEVAGGAPDPGRT